MREYYVYAYIRLDNNTYFYIGKGKNDRYKRIDIRSKHFKNIINKYDCAVEFLGKNLTEDEAFDLEQNTIEQLVFEEGYTCEFFEQPHNSNGHLVNMTFGGEGVSGYRHSEEEKKRCGFKKEEHPMYGKKGELSPLWGTIKTNEHKEKIKMSNPRRKRVICIELNLTFESYREAEKMLLEKYNIVCSHASISAQCRNKISYCGRDKFTNKPLYLHFKIAE